MSCFEHCDFAWINPFSYRASASFMGLDLGWVTVIKLSSFVQYPEMYDIYKAGIIVIMLAYFMSYLYVTFNPILIPTATILPLNHPFTHQL